jgi:hypothetical protein
MKILNYFKARKIFITYTFTKQLSINDLIQAKMSFQNNSL